MNFPRLTARYRRLLKSFVKRTRHFFLFRHGRHGYLLLNATEPTSRELFAGYTYDYDTLDFIADLIRREKVTVFLDVGANWGSYSLMAARAGVPRVEAFEPNRKVFGQLAANIVLNDLHRQIRAWNVAASDRNGEGELFLDPRATDVSTLTPDRMDAKWSYSDRLLCAMRRLDDFMPLSGETLFVKVDVEGAEALVFSGMREILSRNRVHLLVELLDDRDKAIAKLKELGLKPVKTFGTNTYFTNSAPSAEEEREGAPQPLAAMSSAFA
ncbi:FkbM family methyltransferase [Roseibium aestuarii]|uniref:FkbM family methyltransferase n=1 Tax=Roseibium aestuarii TaxID=2600299 RepID=A0ABW4JY17_9HYPH|nr:FkbM family methyltransferase [Roseibium aestuarii]